MIRGWLSAAAAALWLATSPALASPGGDVSVEGNRFNRDGVPWVAEGVTLVGLVSPEGQLGNKPTYAAARAAFGPSMLEEVKRFGADLVRFQVSQAGLDPTSPIHDPAYRDEVLAAVALARSAGLNVIVSMQWQGPAGYPDPTGLPSGRTKRAWRAIIPALADDRGILLEVFNEPRIRGESRKQWAKWAELTQPLIDLLRRQGSENVLLVGGVMYAHSFDGVPELYDPLGQIGYTVHPFLTEDNQSEAQWERKFGALSATRPVMATAFNAYASAGHCRAEFPIQTEALLAYLREKRIGLVAWALDMPNLREPDGSYSTFDGLICADRRDGGKGGAGQMIHEYFLAQ